MHPLKNEKFKRIYTVGERELHETVSLYSMTLVNLSHNMNTAEYQGISVLENQQWLLVLFQLSKTL